MVLELIAGIATYLLLRKLGLSYVAATLGGIMFALNGTFAWLTNAVFNPIAFLPLILLGIEYVYSAAHKNRVRGWVLLALGIAMSLYAGFPEIAYINALLALGWAAIRLFQLPDRAVQRTYIKKLLLAGVGSLLLAAPILVAFIGYLPYGNVGGHQDAYAHASLSIMALPNLLMPYIYGPIFGFSSFSTNFDLTNFWSNVGGFFSVPLFVFAILGLFSRLPKAFKIFLVGWVAICLMKVFGVSIVADIVNLVPGLKSAAFYRYAPSSISFALVLLAAYGIDALAVKREAKVSRQAIIGVVALVTLAGLALIAHRHTLPFATAPHYKWWVWASILWAAAMVVLLVTAPVVLRRRFIMPAIALLVVADALLMFIVPQLSTPRHVPIDTAPVAYMKQHIGQNRFYTLGPIEPNYGTYFQVASINQNDLPVPKKWSQYIDKNIDSNTDPLVFVGYFRKDAAGPSSKQEFFRNFTNYEYTGVKYLVTYSGQLTPQEGTSHGLKQVYKNAAMDIYQLPNPLAYFSDTKNVCKVQSTDRDKATLQCAQPTTVVRRELNMPGWSATVNGQKVAINETGKLFQSVPVPAGHSTVTLNYLPPYMALGYMAFGLSLVMFVLALVPLAGYAPLARLQRFFKS